MIRKTQKNFRRMVRSWPGKIHRDKHNEVVLRETWWLLWFVPLYTRETIERTTI